MIETGGVGAELRDTLAKPARLLVDVHMQRYFVMADSRISSPRLEKKIIAIQSKENSVQSYRRCVFFSFT
jgi:hypothetical protein